MLKHYTNKFREDADEEIADLKRIGITATVGEPIGGTKSPEYAKSLGVVGIYIEPDENDERPGLQIVNEAWDEYLRTHPDGDEEDYD